MASSSPRRTTLAALAAVLMLIGVLVPATSAAAARPVEPAPPPTISNPITASFADTYADPSIIRGKDGWYYLYATSDPLVAGGEFGLMHMARTRDFADWEYLGEVFDETTKPAWAAEESFFWAPDIRYLGGEYLMYYTVTDSAAKPGADAGIGVASAPTPAGPWTDSGAPVVESQAIEGTDPVEYQGLIDPALFTDDDGRNYLYVGGFAGGLKVVELDATGRSAIGDLQQTAISDRYEGSYVVKHDGYYYLMASAAGCCSAVVSGYSVFTGRAESPLGPFVDAEGVPLNQSSAGGTQVIAANGNRWVGVGHHAVITDTSGQDYLIYHGIDRNNGWLEEPGSINRRPTLIDRLDWIDGWPVVNAGAYASDGDIPAPVTTSGLGIRSDAPASNSAFRSVLRSWRPGTDEVGDAGEIGMLRPSRFLDATAIGRELVRGEKRIGADIRLAGDASGEACVRLTGIPRADVCVDGTARELSVTTGTGRNRSVDRASIPERVDLAGWLALTVDLRATGVRAALSESGLNDPIAEVEAAPSRGAVVAGLLTLAASGAGADVDNLSVTKAYTPVVERVADPTVGAATFTDEFEGGLDSGWAEVGGDTGADVADGTLNWPLRGDDLTGPTGTGSILARDAPEGDWVAETKLTLDLGEDTVRNFQQAGMIVYENDDSFLRLSTVALGRARTVEFLKEIRLGDQTFSGGHLDGPTATTMWLRIEHTVNAAGENLYRSASSVDGENWRWGQVWTLPAGAESTIGLQAGGGAEPAATAQFDWFRLSEVG